MNALRNALFPAVLLLALPGCDNLLFAEVEQPEVCKTLPDQLFDGSTYSQTLSVDIGEDLPGFDVSSPEGLDSVFRLTRVDFIAKTGITDFDFVDSAKITVLPPEGTDLPEVQVIDFQREGATTGTVSMTGTNDVDLYAYLTQGRVFVNAALVGRLPDDEWSMDMKICLYAKVTADYLKLGTQATAP
jgi:hypothetical protein